MSRWFLRFLVALVVLIVLWSVLGRLVAWRFEVHAEQAWARALEPMGVFEKRFPKAPTSEAAIELNELAGRLGIEMLPAPSGAPPKLDPVFNTLGAWAAGIEKQAGDQPQAPPKEVADFLSAHASDIEAIVAHLRGGGPIVWETDLGQHFYAPLPRLYSQRDLQSVLLDWALDAGAKDDVGKAAEALDASWKLNQGTRDRVELISVFVAYAVKRREFGTLRNLGGLPEEWQRRVVEDDPRALFLRSLQADAYKFARGMKYAGFSLLGKGEVQTPFTRYVDRPLSAPYFRLCGADYSARLARVAGELRQQPCGTDLAELNDKALAAIPRWNFVARIAMPSLLGWRSAVSTALSAELTQQVLKARALRAAAGGGVWPGEKTTTASATCPGSTWVHERAEDGSLTIALDKVPAEWAEPTPPAFRLRAAPPAPVKPDLRRGRRPV